MKIIKSVLMLIVAVAFVAQAAEEVKITETSKGAKVQVTKVGETRTGSYKILAVPAELEGVAGVSVPRGNSAKATEAFSFSVDKPVTVYLFVDARGVKKCAKILEGWTATKLKAAWDARKVKYNDVIYKKDFPAGKIEIAGSPAAVIPFYAAVVAK